MEDKVFRMNDLQLSKALCKMDVPYHRTQIFNKNNLVWLYKNLEKRNSNHKNFPEVFQEVSKRLENKIFVN